VQQLHWPACLSDLLLAEEARDCTHDLCLESASPSKQIATESADVTMSLWDLGGDNLKTYTSRCGMLPITCVDAVAVLF
jgi:WD40 repeat protein